MYPNNNGVSSQPQEEQWTTGLCGCFEDCSSCMTTCCFPCITFGRNAEIIDQGDTSCGYAGVMYFLLNCCAYMYSHSFRTKMRHQYTLPAEPCGDCCVHCLCASCALCQEHRELSNRGFDPVLGWKANAEKMNPNGIRTTKPPYVAAGMNR